MALTGDQSLINAVLRIYKKMRKLDLGFFRVPVSLVSRYQVLLLVRNAISLGPTSIESWVNVWLYTRVY